MKYLSLKERYEATFFQNLFFIILLSTFVTSLNPPCMITVSSSKCSLVGTRIAILGYNRWMKVCRRKACMVCVIFFPFSLSPRHASVCMVIKISQMTPLLLRRVLSKVISPLSVCSRRNIPVYKTIR